MKNLFPSIGTCFTTKTAATVFGLCAFVATSACLRAEQILGADQRLEVVGKVAFTEGPLWHPDGSVYFSDIENNRIMKLDPSGKLGVFRKPSGKANGLVFDLEGRLVACEGGNRRVTRTEHDGSITVLADRFEGARFNSPNDVTVDAAGNIFFTDPRYGGHEGVEMKDSDGSTIEGVYRIDPAGEVTRVIGNEIMRPNGLAISPDQSKLYVAVNTNDQYGDQRQLWVFDFDADRNVDADSGKMLFDWGDDRGPDGIAIDAMGRIFATAGLNYAAPPHETANKYRAGVYVISPTGELLQTIPVPIDMITNCAFGGKDLKTLYITAGHKLWSIRVAQPGYVAWPH